MGNSGPLDPEVDDAIAQRKLLVAAVLSGNRNFEARIHQSIRANFLMSPPLVVAFAIAGRVDFDPETEALGHDRDGQPVYLRDIWPTLDEIEAVMGYARDPKNFRRLYANFTDGDELWQSLSAPRGELFHWNADSTYLRRPPFFDRFERDVTALSPLRGARALALLGDSVTTDHVSPASTIKPDSPAGTYLRQRGVMRGDFNSYIARRTNHEVMMRGTFANVRLRNLMVPGVEGSATIHQPDGVPMTIYDAAIAYASEGVPLIVVAGEEYGTGSSRDWAAKGPALLGVRAVIARGFERIHRSNLIGMGILPCQFIGDETATSLGLDGSETFELVGIENGVAPRQPLPLRIVRKDGSTFETTVLSRIDTPVESDYFRHGGILPYMLRRLLRAHEEIAA
jgi:aconitate hydratase